MNARNRVFLIFLSVLFFSCSSPKNEELLERLDEILEDKVVYDGYFLDGVEVLKDVLDLRVEYEACGLLPGSQPRFRCLVSQKRQEFGGEYE